MNKLLLGIFALGLLALNAQTIRFKTNLGDIDVEMLPASAPRNVENFLRYMNKGAYNNTVFHRSVRDFIIQAGGFNVNGNTLGEIAQDSPVQNEFRESNVRGTIAMAKLDGNPNSATNQFFFNLSNNNAANLDRQNGGFTVFGRVKEASLAVMDRIAGVPVPSPGPLASPFDAMPLQNYTSGAPTAANFIVIQSVSTLVDAAPPQISENGVVSASAFGAYPFAAPGSFLEIYGSNLSGDTARGWSPADFSPTGGAPTNLEGVSVTVGGQRAFVNFVSPNQVNVQVPSTVSVNTTLPVVVTSRGQVGAAFPLSIRARAGGLLAPASYKIGDRQFVYAARANGAATSPTDGVSGGETIILYGTGFGAVSPFSFNYAGQIVPADRLYTLGFPTEFKIAGQTCRIAFQGLISGFVGLYQFNVEVPFGIPPGDHRLEVTQSSEAIPQTLWIAVK